MKKNNRQNVLELMGNGESHSLFLSNEEVLGLLAESAGVIVYARHCATV